MISIRKNSRIFESLTKKKSFNSQTTLVSPKRGQIFLMSRGYYVSIRETVYLLSNPTNAKRILVSLAHAANCR